jgi:hypothetical protein
LVPFVHAADRAAADDERRLDRYGNGRRRRRPRWIGSSGCCWHGNAPDAIDDAECLADDIEAEFEEHPSSTPLRKQAAGLGEFATYVNNNKGSIVNYGERFRAGERISTGFVESAINQIVDKRMEKRQSMRWTPRGAHLLLQARTRVLNGDLDRLIRSR